MKKSEILDAAFIGARSQLLDIAAFLDRLARSSGPDDFRSDSFNSCIPVLTDAKPDKTRRILEILSDPTIAPIEKAQGKSAVGAWPDFT